MALLGGLGATRRVVALRTLGDSAEQQIGPQLTIASLPSFSERGRRLAFDLDQAGLNFTVTEYLMIRAGTGIGGLALALLLGSLMEFGQAVGVIFSVLGFLVGYWLPSTYVTQRKGRRLRLVEDQLLDSLVSMSKSLRAGVGLTQALDYASRETPEPLGPELQRVVRELHLGADIEVVLDEMNYRIGSPDLEIASTAISIQRRVGGNLSEILNNVASTLRERRAIRQELHATTAKQRIQGNLSALIPIFVALFFYAANPETAKLLIETTTGRIALVAGIFFEIAGLWLIRRLAVIEV
jgi:tight adherence protein B